MNPSSKKVAIATGMTGGHFFPALALAQTCQTSASGWSVSFLIFVKNQIFSIEPFLKSFPYQSVTVPPSSQLYSVHCLRFMKMFIRGYQQTLAHLRLMKPDVLVSFGSYGTLPAIMAARRLGIPIVIHEQNRLSGWANRFAAIFANHVAISFPDTIGNFASKKVKYVGFPLRHELSSASGYQQPTKEASVSKKRCLLVLGGSQGSETLNKLSRDFFNSLNSVEREKIAVIHITGKKKMEDYKKVYQNLEIAHEVHEFCPDMGAIYQRADVALARAGAGTVFELAAFQIPAIFIPYPHAYDHQKHNANYFVSRGAAACVEEKQLSRTDINQLIRSWLWNDDRLNQARQQLGNLRFKNAGHQLFQLIQQTIAPNQPTHFSSYRQQASERVSS